MDGNWLIPELLEQVSGLPFDKDQNSGRINDDMKTREGFVSNSSTSPFVLKKTDITEEQLEAIRNHDQSQAFKDCRWSSAGWKNT